ncbi:EAL domain-containing protein [Devosia sp. CN2-171]|uniref:EAL domain-containing protein n=1 Tax=Devosia sp. CN2-171 TaxID=3400909 RepID=UPI003BF7E1BF
MKSKYSHALMLLAAIAAFLPVLAVDFVLDSYVRVRERAVLQQSADAIASRVQATAYEATSALRWVLADSPSLCTPSFTANVHRQMEQSLYLKQVLVENGDGVQYCDAIGKDVKYSTLTKPLTVPNQTETIEVVKYGDLRMPALKVTQAFGTTRKVSAFVPLLAAEAESLLSGLKPTSMVRISLTDGTEVITVGDPKAYDQRERTEFVVTQSFAGELPIRVTAAVPFAMVRADYGDLDASFTIVAALMAGAFLVLALQYVRRSDLPAFDLERAIAAGELKPYYQPVINLRSGALAGCEVLCRWEKRNGEVVPPGAFIDYAEVTGLALPMTVSLMQQVKADLNELCHQMPELKVSINLFEGHFRDGNVVDDVHTIFSNSSIAFRQLVFEVTERKPIEKMQQAQSVIAGLHALGCRIAMDDTGTGHSNLAYLQTLGVDIVKIDRVFVDMIKPGTDHVPVLDGLITMAHDLGTEVVAEGVETEAQALYLRGRGVVHAQGYLFAPALKSGAFKELAVALNGAGKVETAIDMRVVAA